MKIYNIEQYRDVGFGESLFIVGNGSSISSTNLAKLPLEKTMTVNRAWKLMNAKFHTIIMHSGYIKEVANMKEQPEVLFVAGSPNEVETKYRRMLQNEVCFVPRRSPEWNKKVTPEDFVDLTRGWYPTHTGLFAIQIAYFMGYQNVFLLGFDGYGCHFEADEINPLDDHERHKNELRFMHEAMIKLTPEEYEPIDYDSNITTIYNLHSSNTYKIFPIISIADALDLAKGDL